MSDVYYDRECIVGARAFMLCDVAALPLGLPLMPGPYPIHPLRVAEYPQKHVFYQFEFKSTEREPRG